MGSVQLFALVALLNWDFGRAEVTSLDNAEGVWAGPARLT